MLCNTGACNKSGLAMRVSSKGELPILKGASPMPSNMVESAIWARAITAITGLSQLPARKTKITPISACQIIHKRKLPSCPSQKQEIMYLSGNSFELCCQAYWYS